jgi:hypothetical protein
MPVQTQTFSAPGTAQLPAACLGLKHPVAAVAAAPGILMRSGSIRVNPAQSGQRHAISVVPVHAAHPLPTGMDHSVLALRPDGLPTAHSMAPFFRRLFSSLTPRHSLPKKTSQKRDEPHDDSRLKTGAPQKDRGAQLIVRLAPAMQRPAPLPVPLFERLRSCFSIP